jgi:hypothetical protein
VAAVAEHDVAQHEDCPRVAEHLDFPYNTAR